MGASNVKNRRLVTATGPEKIKQIQHLDDAGAQAQSPGIISTGMVISADAAAAPQYVGFGAVLRVQVAADTYVTFGDETLATVTATTSPAAKLTSAENWWCINCNHPSGWVRFSANPTRIEIMNIQESTPT